MTVQYITPFSIHHDVLPIDWESMRGAGVEIFYQVFATYRAIENHWFLKLTDLNENGDMHRSISYSRWSWSVSWQKKLCWYQIYRLLTFNVRHSVCEQNSYENQKRVKEKKSKWKIDKSGKNMHRCPVSHQIMVLVFYLTIVSLSQTWLPGACLIDW